MVGNTKATTEANRDENEPVLERPRGHERTPADERESYPGDLSVTRKEAFVSIVDELERWDKTDVDIETAAPHYANHPNRPHQHAKPEDVGVVAYYRDLDARAEERSAISCDRWETLTENARAIALWVRRVRLADRCEVETAGDIDDVAALPPSDLETSSSTATETSVEDLYDEPTGTVDGEDPYDVLGLSRDVDDKVVEAVFRTRVNELDGHPDKGGEVEEFQKLVSAREAILE